jgi:hypothetical protein
MLSYVGLILPDLLALILLFMEFSWLRVARECISKNLPPLPADQKWSVENAVVRELNIRFFAGTFFIPGLVSLVSYLGLILENGFRPSMLPTMFVLVMMWIIDAWYCMANIDRPSGAKYHKLITVAFIGSVMLIKALMKAGYV